MGATISVPFGSTDVSATSGNQANAIAAATLTSAAGRMVYITGFDVSASGATSVKVATVTITGTSSAFSYTFVFPAGVTTAASPLVVDFATPVPALAPNQNIVVSCPASGSGGTNCTVNARGFMV